MQFDDRSAIIWLTGKSGTGSRRVYEAVPDLRAYLNHHPLKDDPNAPLLLTATGLQPLNYSSIYTRIRYLGLKILRKHVHPHMFRHTRATVDSRYFTDREMMLLLRWKRPEMVGTYSHLSNRDVDEKDLVLHGLKSKEEILRPIVQTQKCTGCGELNAPIALYCVKCGQLLAQQADSKSEIEALRQELNDLKKGLNLRELEETIQMMNDCVLPRNCDVKVKGIPMTVNEFNAWFQRLKESRKYASPTP